METTVLENGNKMLDNGLIVKSIDAFLRTSIADMEDMVSAQKMKEMEMTRLVFDNNEDCYTTGKTIVIGKNFSVFNKGTDNIIYRQVQGIIVHELAHILYTDFRSYSSFINTAPHKYKKSKMIAKTVGNILEDYRIERLIGERNSFYKKLFLMVRYHIINEASKEIKEREIKNDRDRLNVLVNSLLIIGFTGLPLKTKDNKVNQMILSMIPLVKKAELSNTTQEMLQCADKVMKLIGNLDVDDEDLEMDEDLKSLLGNMRGKGTNSPVEGSGGDSDGYIPGGSGGGDAEEDNAVYSITRNMEKANELAEEMLEELKETFEEEERKLEREDLTGDIINNYFSQKDSERKENELENEEKKIKSFEGDLPPLHQRNRIVIAKPAEIEKFTPTVYDELIGSLKLNIIQTIRKLEELKQIKLEDWEYYQKSGTIDSDSLIRFNVFDEIDIFKTQYPEEEVLNMEVMLLIDCSGSNGSSVLNTKNNQRLPRYKVNQMIALFLHEVMKGMEWKHSIWTFDSGKTENIAPIIPFAGCFDKDAGLKIRHVGARNSNRDGLHIRLAGKHLAGNSESHRKLLIVLSDGQPASSGYSGAPAMKDVYESTQELKELGVKTIGIFSGDESENKYFAREKDSNNGMYENYIFLNNDSIYEFPEKIFELLSKEFEVEEF